MEWRESEGIEWLKAELPGAAAAFTARAGGVSDGPFASLNVGLQTGDEPARVVENRGRLVRALGRDAEGILFGRQVHEADVVRRERPLAGDRGWLPARQPADAADGQATQDPHLTPLVQVADCLPIALAGERGVAMVHGGWRGLAAGIVKRGVEETGAGHAAIGPGIGPCCYEVGDGVLAAFENLGDGIAAGRMLDLAEIARRLLADAGVAEVEIAGICTSCEADRFFSHRRDRGRTGRQAGLVWIEGDA